MSFFVIDKKRLLHHLEYDVRKHARGVLNWSWDHINNLLEITLHIQGVNYIYREAYQSFEDIPIEIRSLLTRDKKVFGYYNQDEEEREEESMSDSLTNGINMQLVGDIMGGGVR